MQTKFATDDVIRPLENLAVWTDKEWYQHDIHTRVPHWRKAVKVDGDFVEK